MARYAILPGFPPHGPLPVPIAANGGFAGAWGGHSEGLVVRFHANATDEWTGNFQPGSGGWQGVIEHPDGKHLIVVARGQGYVVDPEGREVLAEAHDRLFGPVRNIEDVVPLPEFGAVVLSDGLRLRAINKNGLWWQSPRISWDEIRNIVVDGAVLRAESSNPTAQGNEWFPLTVDLTTGQCEDSAYIRQMRSAIPVVVRPSGV